MKIIVFANSFFNLGGGEKIFVEYAKRWQAMGEATQIITNEKGKQFCLEHGFKNQLIIVWPSSWSDKWGILFSSVYKSLISAFRAFFLPASDIDIVFSASFIWPDLFPGLVLKLRNPKIRWVVASYLFVIPPWVKYYYGKPLRSFLLYGTQVVSLFIMKRFADGIFTASPRDIARFDTGKKNQHLKATAVRGGVDYAFFRNTPKQPIIYDCVFVGRLHPQKNIDELITIWKKVVEQSPKRKLAIVGEGYMEDLLQEKMRQEKLEKNITFLGFADGIAKAKILKSSKIFLSASRFDTGNIALDEALACGLPGIVYDLQHLFYPVGVIKIAIGNQDAFVKAILGLLHDEKNYKKLSAEGVQFASTIDWDITSEKALRFIKKDLG